MHRCVVQRIARGDETCLRAVCPLPCLPVCTLRDHYFAALKEDFYLVFSLSLSLDGNKTCFVSRLVRFRLRVCFHSDRSAALWKRARDNDVMARF